jgi:hypothetical protein
MMLDWQTAVTLAVVAAGQLGQVPQPNRTPVVPVEMLLASSRRVGPTISRR